MTDPLEPTTEPTVEPETATPSVTPTAEGSAAGAGPTPARSFASFQPASRLLIGGAAAVVIVIVLGMAIGAWHLDPFGVLMIIAAVVAAGAAWSQEAMSVGPATRPWLPVLESAAGAVATALAGLSLVEMLGDIDDMNDYGGVIGLLLGVVLVAASMAVLWGALQRTTPDLRGTQRGAQVAALGTGLVLLAWILHLVIGFWAFAPATWGLTAIVLAAVLLLSAGREGLPAWLPWVAVGLGVFAAWVAVGQWSALMSIGERELELELMDYLPFLIYVVGILLVIGGGVLAATGGRIALPASDADTGTPSAGSA